MKSQQTCFDFVIRLPLNFRSFLMESIWVTEVDPPVSEEKYTRWFYQHLKFLCRFISVNHLPNWPISSETSPSPFHFPFSHNVITLQMFFISKLRTNVSISVCVCLPWTKSYAHKESQNPFLLWLPCMRINFSHLVYKYSYHHCQIWLLAKLSKLINKWLWFHLMNSLIMPKNKCEIINPVE